MSLEIYTSRVKMLFFKSVAVGFKLLYRHTYLLSYGFTWNILLKYRIFICRITVEIKQHFEVLCFVF